MFIGRIGIDFLWGDMLRMNSEHGKYHKKSSLIYQFCSARFQ